MSEMRRVTAIRNGTVVDHIPSGRAMQVIRLLRIDTDRSTPVSLVTVSYTHLTLPTKA